jgi:hypothetical protein
VSFNKSGKSLEEIAELFGDALATDRLGEIDNAKIKASAEFHEFAVNMADVKDGVDAKA